eukprot:CAMPEP_0168425296 /NCGR_PEP_ID=MMETSP0228-20121227/35253_1 /TAXON_ID=133427 /ORGANISM="Protoceratium reticulatum, Strain CCCM 535 (=CCMP 1889)" /LENGTH=136 /DNA_ID=CAMNT_0008439289 /DNA_START=25 /DNA_END=435 /DNA_ORIENTATION=-
MCTPGLHQDSPAMLRLTLAAALASVAWAVVPADVTFAMSENEKKESVHPGSHFTVKLADFRSTGFVWRLESLPAGISMVSNKTGGGSDEPPFILCNMKASTTFARGDAKWLHYKPWDPAENSTAVLHLKKAADLVV